MIVLRDMIESDIEDYVRWFTVETEWGDWDAPWEPLDCDEEKERKRWRERYESIQKLAPKALRYRLEIERDGEHIGAVSSYTDLGYLENPEKFPAIGLDIFDPEKRGNGAGTEALRQFINYLHEHGNNTFYTQTWSGNTRMLRVAEKLGFREVFRKESIREVRGGTYDALTLRLDLQA